MNQLKLFKTFTFILVILNVAIVAFLLFGRGHLPPHHEKPLFGIIEHKLKLDEAQKKQFKTLREDHHRQMMELDETRDKLLKDYFETLKNGQENGDTSSIMNEIKKVEQQRIDVTYGHFNDVKALCRDEQLAQFPEVLDIAIGHLLQPQRKDPPHPRN